MKQLFQVMIGISFVGCGNEKGMRPDSEIVNEQSEDAEAEENDQVEEFRNAGEFYQLSLVPTMQESCADCHVEGGTGPLTIFDQNEFDGLLQRSISEDFSPFALAAIDDFASSFVFGKLSGELSHGGGIWCDGPEDGICSEVLYYYQLAFAPNELEESDETNDDEQVSEDKVVRIGPDSAKGAFPLYNPRGSLTGWAANEGVPARSVQVEILVGGEMGSGESLGVISANQSGLSGGYEGAHQFRLDIPESLKDGVTRQYYLYVIFKETGEKALAATSEAVAFYKPTPEGQAYYEASVKPKMQNSCGGCHVIDYDTQYANLIKPAPAQGGTASDHTLINKPTLNGVSHGGGRRCAVAASSPCAEIMEWWVLEFGE